MNVKKLSKKQLAAIIIPSATLGVAGISTGIYFAVSKINNDSTVEYFNNVVDKINDFKAQTANEFTKGADISSYAGIVENLLFNNNIKKSDGTWYTYKDIENPDIKVTDEKTKKLVTLEEYINNNLYSYFDENSNRVYENMFSILKKKGINSLRLRFWVDPYDEKGNSYGGGHNDLDTNIFIMKQAKKYGFDDFLINFHYSDFWADPGKHYIPKAWENKTDDELLKISYDYTSDVLNKIYKETGIIPKRVQ
ncbi:MAG: glycosyl hydrolase 53 family protein, partial [Ureaplasma sp.]|nr:glycosyl hydrolase 53 family protein [Ureaplasma sp.]